MHVEHGSALLDERARAPQPLVDGMLGIAEVRQLGPGRAVEDDAGARAESVEDSTVLR